MNSFNFILKATAVAFLTLAGAAYAQATASKAITVAASLTSDCRVATSSAGAITVTFPAYTAFGGAVTLPTATVNFECTRGLGVTPAFAWDNTNGTVAGEGVLAGLRYSLSAANGTFAGGAAPDLLVANDIGTPDAYPVTVDGSIAAGQAGTDTSGTVSHVRTLTVTF